MHRLFAKRRKEPQCQQIEIAVHKAVQSHKLRLAVLTSLMLYHLLANLAKTGLLGQVGYVTMHLAIYLNIFHDSLTIGFQTAVEVMQVLDATDFASRSIEKLRGQRLRQRIVALLFVATHKVITLLLNHTVQVRNLVGRVLKVGIHRDNHIALSLGKATIQSRTLAIVTTELDALHLIWVLLVQLRNNIPRAVGRAVINEDDLIRKLVLLHHPLYPCIKLGY